MDDDSRLLVRLLVCLLTITGSVATALADTQFIEVTDLEKGKPTFVDSRVAWRIGRGQPTLSRTADGGVTWAEVKVRFDGGDAQFEFDGADFISAKTAFLGLRPPGDRHLFGTPAMVSTHDGGATWRLESLPNASWYLQSLAASDDPDGPVWLGGQISVETDSDPKKMDCPQKVPGFTLTPTIYYRPRAQSAWEAQRLPIHNGCPVSVLRFFDDLHGVAIAGNAIMFSRDGGRIWQISTVATLRPVFRPVTLQLGGPVGWIGCEDGAILKTNDGGQHWRELPGSRAVKGRASGFGRWGATYFIGTEIGFTLRANDYLFETRDGGKTWKPIRAPEMLHDLICAQSQCWVEGITKVYRIEENK